MSGCPMLKRMAMRSTTLLQADWTSGATVQAASRHTWLPRWENRVSAPGCRMDVPEFRARHVLHLLFLPRGGQPQHVANLSRERPCHQSDPAPFCWRLRVRVSSPGETRRRPGMCSQCECRTGTRICFDASSRQRHALDPDCVEEATGSGIIQPQWRETKMLNLSAQVCSRSPSHPHRCSTWQQSQQ